MLSTWQVLIQMFYKFNVSACSADLSIHQKYRHYLSTCSNVSTCSCPCHRLSQHGATRAVRHRLSAPNVAAACFELQTIMSHARRSIDGRPTTRPGQSTVATRPGQRAACTRPEQQTASTTSLQSAFTHSNDHGKSGVCNGMTDTLLSTNTHVTRVIAGCQSAGCFELL